MTGDDLRELMETCLPESVLREAVESAGLQQRERRLDPLPFLRAMVMSASSPSGGRQADVVRTYFEAGGTRVVRGSYYEWFGGPLEVAMSKLATIAMGYAAELPRDLPGILGGVKDWRIVDSTTVQLHKRLKEIYPGTGDYAAIKVHKTMSVGSGTTIAYHFSPAREHDSRHLALDESWRGFGLLIDLGYASQRQLPLDRGAAGDGARLHRWLEREGASVPLDLHRVSAANWGQARPGRLTGERWPRATTDPPLHRRNKTRSTCAARSIPSAITPTSVSAQSAGTC